MLKASRHVAVLMGGFSSERPVSLSSGNSCADALEVEGYRVTRIDVDRNVGAALADAGIDEPSMGSKDNATAAISALCAEYGAWAVRVHDVEKSRDAVAIGNAWRAFANV